MTPTLRQEVARSISDALLMDAGYNVPARRAAEVAAYSRKPLSALAKLCYEAEARRVLAPDDFDASFGTITKSGPFADALLRFLQAATAEEFRKLGDSATSWLRPKRVERFLETGYFLKPAGLSTFGKAGDGGELEGSVVIEDSVTRSSDTYGQRYILPRQSFVGQDPKYFFDLPVQMALAARQCLDDLVYDTLAENGGYGPTMTEDSEYLFSVSHAQPNLMTGDTSALSKSSLAAASNLLRAICSEDNKRLKLKPRFLIVPAALEQTALEARAAVGLGATVLADRMPTTESPTASLHVGPLNIVVLPALDDLSTTGWYIAASRDAQCVELLALWSEAPAPQVFPVKTERLALQWAIVLDAGIGVPDWRSIVKSDGA